MTRRMWTNHCHCHLDLGLDGLGLGLDWTLRLRLRLYRLELDWTVRHSDRQTDRQDRTVSCVRVIQHGTAHFVCREGLHSVEGDSLLATFWPGKFTRRNQGCSLDIVQYFVFQDWAVHGQWHFDSTVKPRFEGFNFRFEWWQWCVNPNAVHESSRFCPRKLWS